MLQKINAYYKNHRLVCNALFSVAQIVFVGLTYFIIYTLLLHKLGSEKLGIWSLILSTTSVANVATTGLALSLVKYIAMYNADIDHIKINKYIKTGLFIISLLTGVIIIIVYILGKFFLPKVMPLNNVQEAISLLPLSLMSLFLNAIGGVFLSTLEGLHHSAFRSISYIVSSILFTIVAFLLIDQYGLMGIAIAQVIQAIMLILLGVFFLKLLFRKVSLFPIVFDKIIFKEIFGYSASFQFIGVCTILIEPVVKFMISRFGGLSFVGFYEMGSRLVSQIRALIISANQVMVPYISKISASQNSKNDFTYPIILKLVYYLTVCLMVFIILLSPVISVLWIGTYNEVFVKTLIILSAATTINLISTPAYFSSMGLGKLNGILYSHAIFLVLNIILGYFLGINFGGWGVIVSYSLSYLVCSFVTIFYYHKIYNIKILRLFNSNGERRWIILNFLIYIGLSISLITFSNLMPQAFYILMSFVVSFLFIYIAYNKDTSLQKTFIKIRDKV
ncbi:MAG: hypothetical protein EAZ51_01295 [Sphingobacteriales bacterium]|nr:MAG: hypothetical protein EAZ64_01825 [Sphingobacteriales bacterium]TAF83185.1 MAG: hypothetical protein EAZ51_01295 [Sphingobacteriales bacterium]